MQDIIFSMRDITWTLYDIRHLIVWHHTQYIHDIISNMYDITHTAFMTSHRLCLTSPPLYLTSQPLYLCLHTLCIDDITTSMKIITLGIHMTSYTLYMKSHSHFMISILSIYDIRATAFMISVFSYMWHHSHVLGHLIPYTSVITATLYVMSHPLGLWIRIQHIWHQTHCVETIQTVCLTSHPPYLYLGDHSLCISDITQTVCIISHIL